jgi:teichoic acid transport system ATP-binding protein
MNSRVPGRVVAPLALMAVAIAVVFVISISSGAGDSKSPATTTTATAPSSQKTGTTATGKPKVYVVKQGDLLSTIAEKTGVPIERIEALNPDLDPQVLIPGQSIKIGP